MTDSATRFIELGIVSANVEDVAADVVAVKYPQQFYSGVDVLLAKKLIKSNRLKKSQLPKPGCYVLTPTDGLINTQWALFLGIESLYDFRYEHIKQFAIDVLGHLSRQDIPCRHLIMTLHGVGYGLDILESVRCEVEGLKTAIAQNTFPQHLEKITIVEHNTRRYAVVKKALQEYITHGRIPCPPPIRNISPTSLHSVTYNKSLSATVLKRNHVNDALESNTEPKADLEGISYSDAIAANTIDSQNQAATSCYEKPHIFVAMPFHENFEDIYYYGIQGAIHRAGLLSERADLTAFTGDIMDHVKRRIACARLVVADLTGANANVYLEVGYAWGKGVDTILLINKEDELKFDVKGQRCLHYANIRDLEDQLFQEVSQLLSVS